MLNELTNQERAEVLVDVVADDRVEVEGVFHPAGAVRRVRSRLRILARQIDGDVDPHGRDDALTLPSAFVITTVVPSKFM